MAMTPREYVNIILESTQFKMHSPEGRLNFLNKPMFAPTNIALCKYWGKRDEHLNLPMTGSLSISLGQYGTHTSIEKIEGNTDKILVNGREISEDNPGSNMQGFKRRLAAFLDYFRESDEIRFCVDTQVNIPIAAGLASSACGFAALVMALNHLYGWNLTPMGLSLLARLGSGSACRSLWHGFVEWVCGERSDGLDSVGVPLETSWPAFRVGILMIDQKQKPISSRQAMLVTQKTSPFYTGWPAKVDGDLDKIKTAIQTQDFKLLAETCESNALAMHALMLTATPSIMYMLPETVQWMHQIWQCRALGLPVYFTQDAGPNLKLLFLASDTKAVCEQFPTLQVIKPFEIQEHTMDTRDN